MAKGRHDEAQQTSRTTLIVMIAGGLAVAALVVWALTRTVEPAPTPASTPVAETQVPVRGVEPTDTATTATLAPLANEPPRPNIEGDRTSVKRISVEDMHAKMNRGEITVIDVRDETSFEASHVPGALHIPLARIEGEIDKLPKNKPIVTYCT